MALALHERGVFTWTEWAATLGEEIKKAQAAGDPDTGETYYRHWLARAGAHRRREGRDRRADAGALPRRLGPRRRPHAARHADRAQAGRFRGLAAAACGPAAARISGVCTCSGRMPMPRGAPECGAAARTAPSPAAATAPRLALRRRARATITVVLDQHLHALGDPVGKLAAALHEVEIVLATAPAASGCHRILAAATASWIARLMPTPPIGDIAWAASPMHSRPGRCHSRAGRPQRSAA